MGSFKDFDDNKLGHEIQLAGVIYAGEGKASALLFPGEAIDRVDVVPMTLDEWLALNRTVDYLETEVIANASSSDLAKIVLRKSQREIDKRVMWRVFKRAGYACEYCGDANTPLTVDHLVTWEAGGPPTEENLKAACPKCNQTRGRRTYDAWLASSDYAKVSRNLTPAQRERNVAVAATLGRIARLVHKRGR